MRPDELSRHWIFYYKLSMWVTLEHRRPRKLKQRRRQFNAYIHFPSVAWKFAHLEAVSPTEIDAQAG